MKKQCLSKWLLALRSGEYPQTKNALRNELGYCPLGVLCDISGLGLWAPDLYSTKMKYFGQINYLPREVCDWAGISNKERSEITAFLITYNDSQRLTFLELADRIELAYNKLKK